LNSDLLANTRENRRNCRLIHMLHVAAMRYSRVFVAASAVFAVCAHAQDATPTPSAGELLFPPSHTPLTGPFGAPLGPTAVERAIQSVGDQIEAKRAADAARSQT